MMIEVKNITKSRMFKTILKDCTCTIDRGKVIGIIGENGSGKTTFLQVLAGVFRQDKGTINLPTDRSESIAYSPDQEYFYNYFTIEQLMDYYQSQFGDFDRKKAEQLIDFFELKRNEKINYLSKGQVGRVKIAATIARNAPLLLLDEPLAGLDPLVKDKIIKGLLQFVNMETQTLLITTHELLEIETILDEVIVMKAGCMIAQENVDVIREEQSVQKWFQKVYQKK